MKKIVLISCVSMKLSHRAKAKDLYISPLFRMNFEYARSLRPNKIFILSAKYGLLDPEQEIEPYNFTLNKMRVPQIQDWSKKVIQELQNKVDFRNDQVIFLAGERYRRYLEPELSNVSVPMKGLGIGKQLQFLKRKLSEKSL